MRIRQNGATVEIVDPLTEKGSAADLGFGLGLKLTEQLCQKLHWDYVHAAQDNTRSATIKFSEA